MDNTQHFKWVFTVNTVEGSPSSQEVFDLFKRALSSDENIKDATFQQEAGTETSRPHIQGRLHFIKKRTKQSVLDYFKTIYLYYLDTSGNKYDIILYKNTTVDPERDTSASITYCSKEDSRLPGTVVFNKLLKAKPYTGQDILFLNTQLRDWQRMVLGLIETKPAPLRKIYYFYDPVGASGKSLFSKWLTFNRPGLVGHIDDAGTANQLKATAYNLGPKEVYIVDLPRVRSNTQDDIMRVVEMIKGGKLTTSLYGGAEVILFDPPLVIMFSNNLPDVETMSYDRWEIYHIQTNFQAQRLEVNTVRAMLKAKKAKKSK